MVRAAAEASGLCVLNRPVTTIAYSDYRIEKELEAVTTEENAEEMRKALHATRPSFNALSLPHAEIRLVIVNAEEYEELLSRSREAIITAGSAKARARILDPESAARLATRHPTASSLQDALTIMHRAGVMHVTPESAYAALLNRLAPDLRKAARMTDAQLKRLVDYYAPGAPIGRLTLLEVLGDKRS
jgi:hypothetical protein